MKTLPSAVQAIALAGLLCAPALGSPTINVAPAGTLASQPTIRVMELGDSITAGVVSGGDDLARGGYRETLAQLVAAHSLHVRFVGSRTDYSLGMTAPNHEGWPGYVIRSYPSAPTGQLYGPVTGDALRSYHPDVILLMIGTNDLLRVEKNNAGYTQAAVAHNIDLLLQQIFTLDPGVRLFVAGVVSSPRLSESTIARYDEVTLPVVVAKYQRLGYKAVLVPSMQTAVPRDRAHFPDGLHPYGDNGYALVGAAWFSAIQSAIVASPLVAGR